MAAHSDAWSGGQGLLDDPIEAVTDAVVGGDPERESLEGFGLLAKPADVDVDGLSLAKEFRSPHPPYQLLAGVHPAWVGEQEREQVELLWRKSKGVM